MRRIRPGTNTKKGLIDFVIAVVAGVTYLNFNGTGVQLLNWAFSIPYPVYLLLIVVLIWASINVVNCTDGVDGLSASLAVVSIGTFLLAYWEELGEYATAGVIFIGALLAYLWSNAKPSTLLMGGRRQPRHGLLPGHPGPQEQSPVRIPAGGTGLYRGRQSGHPQNQLQAVFAHQHPEKTLTPLHDHVRKRMGWSDEQVVARWLILQAVASALFAAAGPLNE